MSYLGASPQLMAGAAAEVAGIGSAIGQAHTAAALATTSVVPAAGDEVSAAVAAFFSESGQAFSAAGAKAAAFHDEFVNLLNGGAGRYLNAELANAQQVSAPVVNAAAHSGFGQPGVWTGILSGNPVSQSFSFPYGPFTISGTQTVTAVGQGFAGVTNAAVTLGPARLLTGNAIENFSLATELGTATFAVNGPFLSGAGYGAFSGVTGAFSANFAGTVPLLAVGVSVNGVYPVSGTGSPYITGTALQIDGIPVPSKGITSALNSLLQSATAGS